MAHFVKNEVTTKDKFVHVYSGVSKDELEKKVDELLHKAKYKIKYGKPGDANYERGNRTMRILFGAFHKYFKFDVIVSQCEGDEMKVTVRKESSGMSGGLIGISQVKNELLYLSKDFEKL